MHLRKAASRLDQYTRTGLPNTALRNSIDSCIIPGVDEDDGSTVGWLGPLLKWLWKPLPHALPGCIRLLFAVLGTTTYVGYHGLVVPKVVRLAIEAVPHILGIDGSAWLNPVITFLTYAFVILLLATLVAWPRTKAPPAALFVLGILLPVLARLLLRMG